MSFTIRGAGTVVTGIPTHGRVRAGRPAAAAARRVVGHVRRMQVYGEDATEGRAGECVALNLPELDHEKVRRGMVLCESDAVDAGDDGRRRAAHPGCGEGEDRGLSRSPAARRHRVGVRRAWPCWKSTEMTAGQKQMVQLRLAEPLPLVPGDRFVVRANISDAGRQRADDHRRRADSRRQQHPPAPQEAMDAGPAGDPARRPSGTRRTGAS